MKTLEETMNLIDYLNDEAHGYAYQTWLLADKALDDEDYDAAEELQEEASEEQAEYFRDFYENLSYEDKQAVQHWLKNDDVFKEQFEGYCGK